MACKAPLVLTCGCVDLNPVLLCCCHLIFAWCPVFLTDFTMENIIFFQIGLSVSFRVMSLCCQINLSK